MPCLSSGMHSVSGSGGPAIPQTHSPILTPAPPHPEPLVPGCPDNTHCKTDCKYGYQLGPLRGDGCRLCFCNERSYLINVFSILVETVIILNKNVVMLLTKSIF